MKLIRFSFISICAGWMVFIFFSLLVYIEDNPIRMNYETLHRFKIFFPQGWAFFTKSPRDENIEVFKVINGHLEKIESQRQATFSNLLGIKRNARATSVEYAYLINKAPADSWVKCEIDPETFLQKNNVKAITVENKNIMPLLNGEIVLVRKALIPWAWASDSKNIILPSTILKLNVVCKI